MSYKNNWLLARYVLAASLVFGFGANAHAGENTTSLPNGSELGVSIDDPVTSTEFKVPADDVDGLIDVTVDGGASVGLGDPDATLVYVIDRSGSTNSGSGTGCSPILGCEKKFFKELNQAAIADGSTDLVGVVSYGSSASTNLGLTDPTSSAVNSTIDGLSAGGTTNCVAGLSNATSLVTSGANTNGTSVVVFASDGLCNTGGSVSSAASSLGATGAIVYSVAIGSGSNCTSDGGAGRLNQIPRNGGSCLHVADPGNLPDIIQSLIGATLQSLEIEVDGGGQSAIGNSEITPDLPQNASASVDYSTAAPGLNPADHQICVTANGSDVTGGTGSVTQCETIHLLQLTASPATETNELSVDDSHTVTGEIIGGTGPARDMDFAVGGTNAVTATPNNDTLSASPNVGVDFVYSVPQACTSLGTDTITVSTVIGGMSDSVVVEKEWVDTTAPTAACVETVNPHGNNKPQAPGNGGQGQNQDGFYELLAEDDLVDGCDPLQLFLLDNGSGTVFGPFSVGDKIKYTQDEFAVPEQKKIGSSNGQAGAVAWHIIGNGDIELTATDESGNTSNSVFCLVPPPPK